MLKGYRHICQTQRHNNILKQTHRHKKGQFMFVAFFDLNLVVCTRQVNNTEHLRFIKCIKQIVNMKNWEHVNVSLLIIAPKIDTNSE